MENQVDPIVSEVYKAYQEMRDIQNGGFREFNYSESKERDRTLKEYLDDCQKRANGYTPSRESQGKEQWQANIFTNYTRRKIKAHIATIAKEPPPIKITATNEANTISIERSDIMSKLVRASELEYGGNPEKLIYIDSWNCAINGTIVKYVGYLKTKETPKIITSYDLATGKIEYEDGEEVITEDRVIEVNVPLQNLFIRDPYIADIQQQPDMIWVSYQGEGEFKKEFGKYKNASKVKQAGFKFEAGENILFFGEQWNDRVEKKKIEVVRYYNKNDNQYRIVANGVLLLDTIMLWGKKRKVYPFAKSVYEPFANVEFFYGNSLPNILMASQDVSNAFINSMADKVYRTLNTPMLVGMVNKDSLELEDEYVTGDTRIYVEDVSQVQPMPMQTIQQGEMKMLEFTTRGIDEDSTDSLQSGYGGSGSTAREIVLANERAEELKGLFFILMKDLYVQKTRLRIYNIVANYANPLKTKAIVGADGDEVFINEYKSFNVPGTLSTGETGTLQIGVAEQATVDQMNRPIGVMPSGKQFNELDVRAEMARIQGKPIETIMISSDFLDDWEYDLTVETDNFYQKSRALDKAMMSENIQFIATAFPEIFAANQQELFKEYMKINGKSADKYLENIVKQQMSQMQAMTQQPQESQQGAPGQVSQQITAPTKSLPALVGGV